MGNFIEITGPRCSGKTTSLLRLARDYGYIVVEPTEECAIAVKNMADTIGIDRLLEIANAIKQEDELPY